MTAEDLAQFRALLRAQALPSPRVGIAGRLRGLVGPRGEGVATLLLEPAQAIEAGEAQAERSRVAPPAAASRLFGRREPEPPPPEAVEAPAPPVGMPLLASLLAPAAPGADGDRSSRVRLRLHAEALAETPYLPEDLSDDRPSASARSTPAPGAIAGWSSETPPSARSRLLGRVLAVCEAEGRGLEARMESLAA